MHSPLFLAALLFALTPVLSAGQGPHQPGAHARQEKAVAAPEAIPDGVAPELWAELKRTFEGKGIAELENVAKVLAALQKIDLAAFAQAKALIQREDGFKSVLTKFYDAKRDAAKAARMLAAELKPAGAPAQSGMPPPPGIGKAGRVQAKTPEEQALLDAYEDVFAKLRAEMHKDLETTSSDVAKALTRYLWERPFVAEEFKRQEPAQAGVQAALRAWVKMRPETAAIVYYGLATAFPPLPPWVAAAQQGDSAIVYPAQDGIEPALTDAMNRWASERGTRNYAWKDDEAQPQREVPISPLSPPRVDDWLAGFFHDASIQTVAKLLAKKTSPDDIRRRVTRAWQDTGPNVPGGPGPRRGFPEGMTAQRIEFDDVWGKWGDANVFHLNGDTGERKISIKIYTERGAEGALVHKIGVFDISHKGDVYGREFDLDKAKQTNTLGGTETKNYVLELTPKGDDMEVVFKRPDGTPFKNRDGKASITLNELFRLRAAQAAKACQAGRVMIGEQGFCSVPQSSHEGCFLLFSESAVLGASNPYADPKAVRPENMGCVNKKSGGLVETLDRKKRCLGEIGGKHYFLDFNRDLEVWRPVEGKKEDCKPSTPLAPPPAAPAPGQPGTSSGGPGGEPGGPQGPKGDWPDVTLRDHGRYTAGDDSAFGKIAAAINRKIAEGVNTRLYIAVGDNVKPENRWLMVQKGNDKFPGFLIWFESKAPETPGNGLDIVKDGTIVRVSNDLGDHYFDLREPFGSFGGLNNLGYLDKREKSGPADVHLNLNKVLDLWILEEMLKFDKFKLEPAEREALLKNARFLQENGLPKDHFGPGEPPEAIAKPDRPGQLFVSGSFPKDSVNESDIEAQLRGKIVALYPEFKLGKGKAGETDEHRGLADPERKSGLLAFDKEQKVEGADLAQPLPATLKIGNLEAVRKVVRNGAAIYETEEKVKVEGKDQIKRSWYLRFLFKAKNLERPMAGGPIPLFDRTGDDPKPPLDIFQADKLLISEVVTDKDVNTATVQVKPLDYKPPQGAVAVYGAPSGRETNCLGIPLAFGNVTREQAFEKCSKK